MYVCINLFDTCLIWVYSFVVLKYNFDFKKSRRTYVCTLTYDGDLTVQASSFFKTKTKQNKKQKQKTKNKKNKKTKQNKTKN